MFVCSSLDVGCIHVRKVPVLLLYYVTDVFFTRLLAHESKYAYIFGFGRIKHVSYFWTTYLNWNYCSCYNMSHYRHWLNHVQTSWGMHSRQKAILFISHSPSAARQGTFQPWRMPTLTTNYSSLVPSPVGDPVANSKNQVSSYEQLRYFTSKTSEVSHLPNGPEPEQGSYSGSYHISSI